MQRTAFGERDQQGEHHHTEQNGAGPVHGSGALRPGVRQVATGEHEAGQADGHIDEEDRAPGCAVEVRRDQETAEQLADDGRDPAGSAVAAERASPPLAGRRRLDGGKHLRHHHRGRRALRCPCHHEHGRGRREPADERGDGERCHAGQEEPPSAEAVAKPATHDKQQGIRARIRRNDQFEHGRTCVQIAVDARQCHVDDEEVDHGQQHAEQQRGQASGAQPGRSIAAAAGRRGRTADGSGYGSVVNNVGLGSHVPIVRGFSAGYQSLFILVVALPGNRINPHGS